MANEIIFTDRSTWKKGWIAFDEKNHLLICVTEDGTVVGTCNTLRPPDTVKRWIVKVGEFNQVNITNQNRYIKTWNQKMVDDDDDRYKI